MTRIFVFGSNLAGRHGAGAAKEARLKHGAVYGEGIGRTGNAYAIPTLDGQLRKLQLNRIRSHVIEFRHYAKDHPELEFYVTRIGCGLAGFHDNHIAPMFHSLPSNCILPVEWLQYLSEEDAARVQHHHWEDEQRQ